MRRLVHLSDLHFGRDHPDLAAALVHRINDLAPDLVAISGDLTQRARNSQFRAARRFIDTIVPPVLSVPGNHDVPLDNLYARLLRPYRRYRRWIATDLEPVFRDDTVVVVGINSVNPYNWQRGRLGLTGRIARAFEGAGDRLRLLALHHPLDHPPNVDKRLIRGAEAGLKAFADMGVDGVLSGHLHLWSAALYPQQWLKRAMVQIRVGTALSTRQRGEENDFNLLTLSRDQIRIDRFATDQSGTAFGAERSALFRRTDCGWRPSPGG
jgi:3',5'-cyclic AMP phosphodiesterase CpdA